MRLPTTLIYIHPGAIISKTRLIQLGVKSIVILSQEVPQVFIHLFTSNAIYLDWIRATMDTLTHRHLTIHSPKIVGTVMSATILEYVR